MFNPNNYKAKEPKALPVVLMLDVSGSMSGDKINKLNDAVVDIIKEFANEMSRETLIKVSIVTFGANVKLEFPFTSATDLVKNGYRDLQANGMTPLGECLRLVKDMIEDKTQTPSNVYRPAIVLVSDGAPNDEWRGPLNNFIGTGRSSKCQRFAIGIGNDADYNVLLEFTGDKNNLFRADNAMDIVSQFKKVSMSISQRANSVNPNLIIQAKPIDNISSNDDDDDSMI